MLNIPYERIEPWTGSFDEFNTAYSITANAYTYVPVQKGYMYDFKVYGCRGGGRDNTRHTVTARVRFFENAYVCIAIGRDGIFLPSAQTGTAANYPLGYNTFQYTDGSDTIYPGMPGTKVRAITSGTPSTKMYLYYTATGNATGSATTFNGSSLSTCTPVTNVNHLVRNSGSGGGAVVLRLSDGSGHASNLNANENDTFLITGGTGGISGRMIDYKTTNYDTWEPSKGYIDPALNAPRTDEPSYLDYRNNVYLINEPIPRAVWAGKSYYCKIFFGCSSGGPGAGKDFGRCGYPAQSARFYTHNMQSTSASLEGIAWGYRPLSTTFVAHYNASYNLLAANAFPVVIHADGQNIWSYSCYSAGDGSDYTNSISYAQMQGVEYATEEYPNPMCLIQQIIPVGSCVLTQRRNI